MKTVKRSRWEAGEPKHEAERDWNYKFRKWPSSVILTLRFIIRLNCKINSNKPYYTVIINLSPYLFVKDSINGIWRSVTDLVWPCDGIFKNFRFSARAQNSQLSSHKIFLILRTPHPNPVQPLVVPVILNNLSNFKWWP